MTIISSYDQLRKNKKKATLKRKLNVALTIGFFAGLFWGGAFFVAYYINFSNLGTSMFVKPFLKSELVNKWQGHLIGWIIFILLCEIVAIIYSLLLTRYKTPWMGILYGIVIWGLIMFILNPLIKFSKPFLELGYSTNSVLLSVFILTGLFIGYSLSTEFE